MPLLGASNEKSRQADNARREIHQFEHVVWWRDAGMRKLYFYCMIACLASCTTGYDGSLVNGLQILPVWEKYFNNPAGSKLGLFGAIYSIGSFASLPFAPLLSDWFGRRSAMAAGCVILIVGAALQGASNSFGMFIGSRFMVGFGNTLTQLSSPLLLTEICHPQHRSRCTAIYNCLWNLGAVIATWLTFGTFHINNNWAWRIPSIIQAAPSAIQLIFIYWMPESPRWLVSKGRNEQALGVLAKYHANGDVTNDTVLFEYAEIKETIRLETQAKNSSSYLDFLKTRGNRYRSFLLICLGLFSQWSGSGLISYYFNKVMDSIGITNATTQFIINGCLTIWSLLVSLFFSQLIDKVGRRKLFLISTGCMVIMFTFLTICAALYNEDGNKAAGKAVVAFIFLYSTSYSIAWNGLLTAYTVEILPFKLRSKGYMIMNFWVNGALIFNQYVNPIGLGRLSYKFYYVYCVWLAVEFIIVYVFFIETKGPTLEEIAKIFDGANANIGVADVMEVKADLSGNIDTAHVENVLASQKE